MSLNPLEDAVSAVEPNRAARSLRRASSTAGLVTPNLSARSRTFRVASSTAGRPSSATTFPLLVGWAASLSSSAATLVAASPIEALEGVRFAVAASLPLVVPAAPFFPSATSTPRGDL